jgi:hypothetical protein
MLIDLKPFCAYEGEYPSRKWLETPFSRGDFSYATNGAVMVRVPRRANVSDIDVALSWLKLDEPLQHRADLSFRPVHLRVPGDPPVVGRCGFCGGCGGVDGLLDADCPVCGGIGWSDPELRVSTWLEGLDLGVSYLRRIAALPDLAIAFAVTPSGVPTLQFSFDGGIGCLAGLRRPYEKTIEIACEDR